eukprot:14145747-Alexandrium_andersonii.AAC.1
MKIEKASAEMLEAAWRGSASETWREGTSKNHADTLELFREVFGGPVEINDEESDTNEGVSVGPDVGSNAK